MASEQAEKVYLMGTCLIDTFYPQAGLDAVALLELCNLDVLYPAQQSCCGQPAYNSGFSHEAQTVAKHCIDTFSEHSLSVIVPSASCAAMINLHYPKLLEQDPVYHAKALSLANRTYELISFISPRLPYNKQILNKPQRLALHTSCAAFREMKCADSWSQCLGEFNGIDLQRPAYEEECCGFGGTFSVKSPEVSLAMATDKCRHLKDTQCCKIISGDCGCLMNLSGLMFRQKSQQLGESIPCEHIATTVARQFGLSHE